MDLGVHVPRFDWPGQPDTIAPTLARTAVAAEAIGATHLSLMDHYFQMEAMWPATEPMLEGYTALGFLAGVTSKVRLGLLVTGVTYRHPGLLAKIVTTVDVLSGGRGELGIGAAWYEREHQGLGVPYPSTSERFERLEETLQICRQMWSDNDGPYEGKHYQLAETLCSPRPISSPHPPILIGGTGEKKTLRLVAQYADACNLFGESPEFVQGKLDVLRRHCDDVGRNYAEIRKTILYVGDPADHDTFLRSMERFAAIGVEQVIVMPTDNAPDIWLDSTFGPVVDRLAEIKPAG